MRCNSLLAKPASAAILSSCLKVYASPDAVIVNMPKANAACSGGLTRSSFGTNSSTTAGPPSFSDRDGPIVCLVLAEPQFQRERA